MVVMVLDAQLVDLDYVLEENQPTVRLFCRSAQGETVVVLDRSQLPYFYVLPQPGEELTVKKRLEELDSDEFTISRVKQEQKKVDGEAKDVLKVYVLDPTNIKHVKDQVKGWQQVAGKREFSLPFYKRYLIDQDISPLDYLAIEGQEVDRGYQAGKTIKADKISVVEEKVAKNWSELEKQHQFLAFDLETYQDQIIMASLVSQSRRQVITYRDFSSPDWVEHVDSEKELIERLIELLGSKQTDIILGYNTDNFDFELLRKRARHYDLELKLGLDRSKLVFQRRGRSSSARIKGRLHLDLYRFVQNIISRSLTSDVLTLDKVAGELLGENKRDMDWEEIKTAWKEGDNLPQLCEYSLRDSELVYELGKRLIPQLFALSRLTSQIPFDVCRTTYGQLIENYLIKQAFERDIIVPNRPKQSDIKSRRSQPAYSGGFVKEPQEGLHEHLALFDYRSLYPTIIVAYNISPDTFNCDCCQAQGMMKDLDYHFCSRQKGFLPQVLEKLLEERFKIKDKMEASEQGSEEWEDYRVRQESLKLLLNSAYGYTGYSGARWYCRECAEAITHLGRDYIHKTIEQAEAQGLNVIYSDTDSVLVQSEAIEDKAESFLQQINSELPQYMQLEFEDYYQRGLFTYTEKGRGAKKKYALLGQDGSIKVTGFEQVRRDWSQLAKETQEKVIEHVLRDEVDQAVRTVKDTVQQLQEGKVNDKKLVIYTQLKKKPENYETTSPHVEAAKKAIERGIDIEPGATVDYIITERGSSISDKAEISRFADSYDASYYIEHQIVPAALRVLKVLGYSEEDLLLKGKQSGLDKFT